jgi:hypothetical protein
VVFTVLLPRFPLLGVPEHDTLGAAAGADEHGNEIWFLTGSCYIPPSLSYCSFADLLRALGILIRPFPHSNLAMAYRDTDILRIRCLANMPKYPQ